MTVPQDGGGHNVGTTRILGRSKVKMKSSREAHIVLRLSLNYQDKEYLAIALLCSFVLWTYYFLTIINTLNLLLLSIIQALKLSVNPNHISLLLHLLVSHNVRMYQFT